MCAADPHRGWDCVPDSSSAGDAAIATPPHATAGGLKKKQGDYYAGDKMVLNAKRMAAIKKCTDGIKFNSDRYIACMSKEGESP